MPIDKSTKIHHSSVRKRDTTSLNLLIEKLSPRLDFMSYPAGKRFVFTPEKNSCCYFVRAGIISLYRQPNDVLVELIEAPMLLGTVPLPPSSQFSYTVKVSETADIAILELDQLYSLLTELQLWEHFARHMQVMASVMTDMLFKHVSVSVFELVRTQLYELMDQNVKIRNSISAEKYIRSKTRVSRSSVMRMLSDLKAGGYIVIENGILKAINNIPARY